MRDRKRNVTLRKPDSLHVRVDGFDSRCNLLICFAVRRVVLWLLDQDNTDGASRLARATKLVPRSNVAVEDVFFFAQNWHVSENVQWVNVASNEYDTFLAFA